MNYDQMAQQSYNSSKALENQFNQQANDYTNQYNQAANTATTAQNDLTNFRNNMVSGNDAYQQQLAQANKNAGYDVNNLNQAQNQVSQVTGILGGLPRAVQASNANYGATAGDVAGQYSTEASNLNQTLGLANQNAQNQIAKMNAGLTGAQQGTQSVLTAQDQKRQAYEAAASNAVNIMHEAQQTMDFFKDLAAKQGSLTAQQQQYYASAKASQAAAAQSYAEARAASAKAALDEQSFKFNNDQRSWYDSHGMSPTGQTYSNPTGPAAQPAQQNNQNNNGWMEQFGQTMQNAGHATANWFGDVAHNMGWFGA